MACDRRTPAVTRVDGTTSSRRGWLVRLTCVVVLTLAMAGASPRPADAHTRVFLGLGAYAPYPSYPYAYSYPAYGPYYSPYRASGYVDVPPPGWVPGHWAYRHDRSGRRVRVWVPGHLD